MSNLPANWSQTKIGDLCKLVNGMAFKPSEWGQSGLPIVRIQNLNRPDAPFNFFDGPVAEKFLVEKAICCLLGLAHRERRLALIYGTAQMLF